jgi:hypothetical protein
MPHKKTPPPWVTELDQDLGLLEERLKIDEQTMEALVGQLRLNRRTLRALRKKVLALRAQEPENTADIRILPPKISSNN